MIKFTKVIVIALITACVLPLKSHARLTAAEAFASAPQSVFPLLDKNARLDMIDYFNSGSSASSSRNNVMAYTRRQEESIDGDIDDSLHAGRICLQPGG